MNKIQQCKEIQQYKEILEQAPEWAIEFSNMADGDCYKDIIRYYGTDSTYQDKQIAGLDLEYPYTMAICSLMEYLDQAETIERLEKRELEAENILNRLIEEEGCYCSDFGNLLEPEDQDSKIVADAIRFMNNHVQKFKELNND